MRTRPVSKSTPTRRRHRRNSAPLYAEDTLYALGQDTWGGLIAGRTTMESAWAHGERGEFMVHLVAELYRPAFLPSVLTFRHGAMGQPGRLARSHRPTPRRSLAERSPLPPLYTFIPANETIQIPSNVIGASVRRTGPSPAVHSALANADAWPFNDPEIVG